MSANYYLEIDLDKVETKCALNRMNIEVDPKLEETGLKLEGIYPVIDNKISGISNVVPPDFVRLSDLWESYENKNRENFQYVSSPEGNVKPLLNDIPEKERTYEVCLAAVKTNPENIRHYPGEVIPGDILEIALSKDGSLLSFLKDQPELEEKYIIAGLSNHGEGLVNIPYKYRTKEMSMTAMENSLAAVHYVPPGFINDDFLSACMNRYKDVSYGDLYNVGRIPHEELRLELMYTLDNNLVKSAIDLRNGIYPEKYLELPFFMRTNEMNLISVDRSPAIMEIAHDHELNPELCLKAELKYPGQLNYSKLVPDYVQQSPNIYTFHKEFAMKTGESLDFDMAKKVYNGHLIQVKMYYTENGDKLSDVLLIWDKEKNDFKTVNAIHQNQKILTTEKPPKGIHI